MKNQKKRGEREGDSLPMNCYCTKAIAVVKLQLIFIPLLLHSGRYPSIVTQGEIFFQHFFLESTLSMKKTRINVGFKFYRIMCDTISWIRDCVIRMCDTRSWICVHSQCWYALNSHVLIVVFDGMSEFHYTRSLIAWTARFVSCYHHCLQINCQASFFLWCPKHNAQ